MGQLDGRIALVTGAAGGIGRATVEALAEAGATVVASDLTRDALADLERAGPAVLALAQDVTAEADWQATTGAVLERFGRLDILVNNAGRALTRSLEETSLEDWRAMMAVNADSVFLGVKHGIAAMREPPRGPREQASIVNLSSLAGLIGAPMLAAYSAAKGAVRLFTKTAALHCAERGYPIRVNSVHPGFVDTAMLDGIAGSLGETDAIKESFATREPLGRLADPREIADAVVFLAGPQSSYMTGSELVVDGGYSAK